MTMYAKVCVEPFPRSRARTVWRSDRNRQLPGSSDAFDRALAVFAESYANQNERDYEVLQQAVESGRVEAQTGI